MIGYPVFIRILGKLYKNRVNEKDYGYEPTVTVMIVAHNEEKVMKAKLENVSEIDYPAEKYEILVASDNSTDTTNQIVKDYIEQNKNLKIRLFEVKNRMGKTNAQNEAMKVINSEVTVFTDANAMLEKNAVKELVASFSAGNIKYVSGCLKYRKSENSTNVVENAYWEGDLKVRLIESRIQTITAGNGALYACKTADYHDFPPIRCHDFEMPYYFAMKCERAICNKDALAYEKTGENYDDELKRKVRMSREILSGILPSIKLLNIFKYKWYTVFFLGHRSCRYLLWIMHILVLLLNIPLAFFGLFFQITLGLQLLFYLLAILKMIFKINIKPINLVYYYCLTVTAQLIGAFNMITGRSKPFWEKAESTR